MSLTNGSKNKALVYHILEGPQQEFDFGDIEDTLQPYVVLCMAVIDNKTEELELGFDSFNTAYRFCNTVSQSIDPVEVLL